MKENLSAGRLEFLRDLAVQHPDSVNLEGETVLALIDQIERLQGENSTLADLAKARHEWNKKNRTELKERLEQAEQDRDKLRNRLDAMRRQRDGYRNQLRKTEQQVARVREFLEYRKANSAVARDGLLALDGDTRRLADQGLGDNLACTTKNGENNE